MSGAPRAGFAAKCMTKGQTPKTARESRLASALRDNLRRRKAAHRPQPQEQGQGQAQSQETPAGAPASVQDGQADENKRGAN